jgi:hypothetical protein
VLADFIRLIQCRITALTTTTILQLHLPRTKALSPLTPKRQRFTALLGISALHFVQELQRTLVLLRGVRGIEHPHYSLYPHALLAHRRNTEGVRVAILFEHLEPRALLYAIARQVLKDP